MKYAKIKSIDVANGTGIRISLYVSGCRRHCTGCFNPQAWDFNYGEPFTKHTEDVIILGLDKKYVNGLSVLGGEPLEPENAAALLPLLKRIKKLYPRKPTWIYTGFKYDDVKDMEILKYADVLVDGAFQIDKRDLNLKFRGSSNQRIINLKDGVEWELED